MLTRVLVVQPLFSVVLDETGEPVETARAVCQSHEVGEQVGANGAILSALAGLIQKATADLPTLLPEILSLIGLFGSTANGTKVGETVGANGAILAALSSLLQKAVAALPTILPEILQLISLFGGTVQAVPTPSAN